MKAQKGNVIGIATRTSETAFTTSGETFYDFVTNPENWTDTYPGSAHTGDLSKLPFEVGDREPARSPD